MGAARRGVHSSYGHGQHNHQAVRSVRRGSVWTGEGRMMKVGFCVLFAALFIGVYTLVFMNYQECRAANFSVRYCLMAHVYK